MLTTVESRWREYTGVCCTAFFPNFYIYEILHNKKLRGKRENNFKSNQLKTNVKP